MFLLVYFGYLALMREKPDLQYSPESIYKFILIKAHFSLLVSNQYISIYIYLTMIFSVIFAYNSSFSINLRV